MNVIEINRYAKKVFAQNYEIGWWDDMNRNPFVTLQLINTELAEATEGDRCNLVDNHLPSVPMAHAEIADVMIRAFDLAGRYGWEFTPLDPNKTPARLYEFLCMVQGDTPPAVKHLGLTGINCAMARSLHQRYLQVTNIPLDKEGNYKIAKPAEYDYLLYACMYMAEAEGFDLDQLVRDKLAYNKQRADHKREAREQSVGKKY